MCLEWHRDRRQNQVEFLAHLTASVPDDQGLKLSIFFYKADEFGAPQHVLLKDYQGWGINYGTVRHWAPDILGAIAHNLKCPKKVFETMWNTQTMASFLLCGPNIKHPQLILFVNVPDSEELNRDFFAPYGDLGVWIDRNDLFSKKYVNKPGDFDSFLPMLLDHKDIVGFLVSPHKNW